jgi:Uma2 family endonuclease
MRASRERFHHGALPKMQCYDAAEATMATTMRRAATEKDLLAMPDDGHKHELVDGEIRVSPAGNRQGVAAAQLVALLVVFAKQHRLGHVMTAEAGFRLPSKNVRCPDVSFVASGRFPDDRVPADFGNLAPDLAVEVLSPNDRPRYMLDKVGEYLEAGVRLIWVIDPKKPRAIVYRSLSDVRELEPTMRSTARMSSRGSAAACGRSSSRAQGLSEDPIPRLIAQTVQIRPSAQVHGHHRALPRQRTRARKHDEVDGQERQLRQRPADRRPRVRRGAAPEDVDCDGELALAAALVTSGDHSGGSLRR